MPLDCHSPAIKQWLSTRPEASSLLIGTLKVKVQSAGEGRGLGLFACHPIQAFSEIISEPPLILMKPGDDLPQLYEQFINLEHDRREDYLSLSCYAQSGRDERLQQKLFERGFGQSAIDEMIRVAGIMQTNAFNVDLADGKGSTHRALFPLIARLNHSCAPNAHVCFYPPPPGSSKRGRMVVHALKSLDPGEEILISYFSILLPRKDRQDKSIKWGFACICTACDSEMSSRQEQQRQALESFTSEQARIMQDGRASLKQVNEAIKTGTSLTSKTAESPEKIPALPDIYDGLAMLNAKSLILRQRERERGDVVTALEQATIWEARITGATSPAALRRLHKLAQFAATKDATASPFIEKRPHNEYAIGWTER